VQTDLAAYRKLPQSQWWMPKAARCSRKILHGRWDWSVSSPSSALRYAVEAEQLTHRLVVQPRLGVHAIVRSTTRHAVETPPQSESLERRLRFASTRLVELGGIEIRQPDLNPMGGVDIKADTQSIAVADIADKTGEALARLGQGALTRISLRKRRDGPKRQYSRERPAVRRFEHRAQARA
jgi:hypothetical protein